MLCQDMSGKKNQMLSVLSHKVLLYIWDLWHSQVTNMSNRTPQLVEMTWFCCLHLSPTFSMHRPFCSWMCYKWDTAQHLQFLSETDGLLHLGWLWSAAPSRGISISWGFVSDWWEKGVWDGRAIWFSICCNVGIVPDWAVRQSEVFSLHILNPHLWPWALIWTKSICVCVLLKFSSTGRILCLLVSTKVLWGTCVFLS